MKWKLLLNRFVQSCNNLKLLHKYYSNAKLLLTGEYLVLHGALAFAVPLKYGQMLEVYDSDQSELEWIAYEKGKEWLHFLISPSEIENQTEKGNTEKEFVCYLLNRAKFLNAGFLKSCSVKVKTKIDFDRAWGLGTSSSLINNVAQWADVNPYELHAMVSNGSGYDIACANYCKPILFRRQGNHPMIYPIDFDPSFLNQLHFIYRGNKQNSEESVKKFLNGKPVSNTDLESISLISKRILQSENTYEFDALISEHERFISQIIDCKAIKGEKFSDFKGSIKSLGAWGGDFILVRTDMEKRELHSYFFEKGLTTIFSWKDLVLDTN